MELYRIEKWNYIELKNDFYIEGDKEYWFGYYSTGITQFPIAIDAGPAVAGKGDMTDYGDGWMSFYDYGFDVNVCIKIILENPEGRTIELSGYNVYADNQLIGSINDPQTLQYVDNRFVRNDVEYCVTAVYGAIESSAECVVAEVLSVSDNMKNSNITVFPNPTDNMLTIEGIDVSKIMVYNKLGQLVNTIENTNNLKVASYPTDLYLMKIISVEGEEYNMKFIVK